MALADAMAFGLQVRLRATHTRELGYSTTTLTHCQCGLCGANFVIGDKRHYVCASRTNGGLHACRNHLRIVREVAQSRILAGIKAELMAPEYLNEFKREFRVLRAAQQSARKRVWEARKARLAGLEQAVLFA